MDAKITVFTPTYNRAAYLPRCYRSLMEQRDQRFVWLIVDDGSTDDTRALVRTWQREGAVDIRYIYQQNQGMHGAHNTAYSHIDTELNVCLDSDDFFYPDAVHNMLLFWEMFGTTEAAGFAALNTNMEGRLIGTPFPSTLTRSTLFDLYNRWSVRGDKKLVYRTELTKLYPYPLFHGERYVGLAYKYYKLDQHYPLLLMNEPVCYVDYQLDGSSHNMLYQYKSNPQGFAFYRRELMQLEQSCLPFQFRQCIHYVSSSMLGRNRRFLRESPKKGATIAAIPFGALLYCYIQWKTTA
ncbi:glycosyltransferase family A protein [Alkalicoccus chagannorensis]|uniref:glycosyltransferase family A protein n=1 Tax=Alkalicoccus chagannorensis TaxID=427072 RepID=UPI000420E245|nr:glycosyltransferase family A protein [Alkalicoccus chagannorensis]